MSWLRNLSAQWKLMLAFVVVSVLLSAVSIFALQRMGLIADSLEILKSRDLTGIQGAYEAQHQVTLVGRAVRTLMTETERTAMEKQKAKMDGMVGAFDAACKQLEPTLITAEGKATLAEVRETFPRYLAECYKVIDAAMQNKANEAKAIGDAARPLAVKVEAALDKLVELKKSVAAETVEAGNQTYRTARIAVIVAIALGIAISMILAWVIARWFTKALLEVSAIADTVASASQQLAAASEELSSGTAGASLQP